MASQLPVNFSPQGEGSIASYNWIDIGEGTGIVKFYGFALEDSTGLSYGLSTNPFYSAKIETYSNTTASTSYAKMFDLDFDLSAFNLPKIIEGTATINYFHYHNAGSSGSAGGTSKFVFQIRKWDGASEIDIISVTGPEVASSGTNNIERELECVEVAIPKTHFKKGETLRISVECWLKKTGDGSGYVYFGHDPQNRDGTYIKPSSDDPTSISKLEIFIPFNLDL